MRAFGDYRLDSPEQNLKADRPVLSSIGPEGRHGTGSPAGAGLGAKRVLAGSRTVIINPVSYLTLEYHHGNAPPPVPADS